MLARCIARVSYFRAYRIEASRIQEGSETWYRRERSFAALSLFAAEYLKEHPEKTPSTEGVSEVAIDGLADAVSRSNLRAIGIVTEGSRIFDSSKKPYRFYWSADRTLDYFPPFSRSVDDGATRFTFRGYR